MKDIKGSEGFAKLVPLNKGLSRDEKYRIETSDGRRLLLRTTGIDEYERKKTVFEMMKKASVLGIPMPEPVDFGICCGGNRVYSLLTWCDGEDLETALPALSKAEQYSLGLKAGAILRKIHSIPAPATLEEWSLRYKSVIDPRLRSYHKCGLRVDGDNNILGYLESNAHMLENRPQCYLHGDFHMGNILLNENELSIIDWDNADFDNYGDPWLELSSIAGNIQESPHFASGLINGYFGEVPSGFWPLFAYYVSAGAITAIAWALYYFPNELDGILELNSHVLKWFENMKNPVPSWYVKMHIQASEGILYRLKAPFDMSFISKYGRVFRILDDQDSGNICLGVEKNGKRYFIKFAGASTVRYDGIPEDATERLKAAVSVYKDLRHKNLVNLVDAEEIGGGFAVVFDWSDAICMGRMYPDSRKRIMQLPIEAKMSIYEEILDFHAYAAELGYVAIDFYDGSIMYDLKSAKTIICDIDFYAKKPYINRMGRLWGSSRFMSPEEFTQGAEINEVSNVYAMGATAFALFSEYDRSPDKWPLSKALYCTAFKAVSNDPAGRQKSIIELINEWKEAKKI